MPPESASLLADAILVLHVAVVAFVVGGEILFLIGAKRWRWIRRRGLRIAHIALMLFIAVQSWLGQLCPLTVWEQALRRAAGERGYSEGFIEHWLSKVLYLHAPWWAFVLAYSAFAALVVATWFLVPPERRGTKPAR